MSLSRFGDDIARAVAGELSAADEALLREHLRGCDACRAHYDVLSVAARAAKGSEPTATEARRAEERLFAVLDPRPVERPKRSLAFWALAVPVAVALVLGIVTTFVTRPTDVVLRGGAEADAGRFSVQLYARPKEGGAVRLAAEYPGSGEGKVSAREWLQVKFVSPEQSMRVFAVDLDGAPTLMPSAGSVALTPGRYQLWVLSRLSQSEAEALETARAPWPPGALPVPLDSRAQVAQGTLQVEP